MANPSKPLRTVRKASKRPGAFAEIANGAGPFAEMRHSVAVPSKSPGAFARMSHTVAKAGKPLRTVRDLSKPIVVPRTGRPFWAE